MLHPVPGGLPAPGHTEMNKTHMPCTLQELTCQWCYQEKTWARCDKIPEQGRGARCTKKMLKQVAQPLEGETPPGGIVPRIVLCLPQGATPGLWGWGCPSSFSSSLCNELGPHHLFQKEPQVTSTALHLKGILAGAGWVERKCKSTSHRDWEERGPFKTLLVSKEP